MEIIKVGTAAHKEVMKTTSSYAERLDYDKLKVLIKCAEEGDVIIINRPHSHIHNVVKGLLRRGLSQSIYKLKTSVSDNGEERLLVIKL